MLLAATLALTITLGLPQVITGPVTNHIPDTPVFALNDHLYLSNGTTWIYENGSLINTGLAAGDAFDSCGAWLHGAYQDGATARGWYHAEGECWYENNFQVHKTIGYAESSDGGLTWVKPDYPNNQVIRAPDFLHDTDIGFDDEGDFSVTRNGDYYYLYFFSPLYRRVHLARSLISDGGRPGTWYKWYQGNFAEPGLGGWSDPIVPPWQLWHTWVSYNTYLGRWVGFHHRSLAWGLSSSVDGIAWEPIGCTIFNTGGQTVGRSNAPLNFISYMSIIGLDGNSETAGQSFWIYYLELKPGESFDKRYLMRRMVTMDGSLGGCTVQDAEAAWLPVVEN